MNCWHCNTELIWGGDVDCEMMDGYEIETNLSCPQCESLTLVFWPSTDDGSTDDGSKTIEKK